MSDTPLTDGIDLPVLPLRDVVVFPHMVIPLFVGRLRSIKALEAAMAGGKNILLVAQKDATQDVPAPDDIYRVGTVASILQLLKMPDGTVKVLVEGEQRAAIVRYTHDRKDEEAGFTCEAQLVDDNHVASRESDVLVRAVAAEFEKYVKLNPKIPPELLTSLTGIDNPGRIGDTIAAHLNLRNDAKQKILELFVPTERLEHILGVMDSEIDLLQVEKRIRTRVKKQMEKSQREYYLNEQMKAIQKELGDMEDVPNETDELARKIKDSGMSAEARGKAENELKKLKMMSPMSAEATVVRNYIDWLLAVPWKKQSRISKDLVKAQKILDDDHYGLEKVKDRILEYLAVQQRVKKSKAAILCLVGPPGVGKTSLGQSIARATNRKFLRMSLGGVRDEAEIRGHRRTYIGSMPGKVIQNLAKAKTRNPLFMLDEVDKMSMDFRGDPSSALLEVLDPEQNHTFGDHYLEVDYDLSDVMFIATANTLNIPGPLLDRMEVIRISGYTEEEKCEIADRYLLPKQRINNGLKESEVSVSGKAIREIIASWTREAGVRNLEREIAKIFRKVVKEFLLNKRKKTINITPARLEKYLGVKKQMEKSQREYYLNEQMKAIQKELGDMEDVPNETDELARKIKDSGMSAEARGKAENELKKLKMMSPMSAEATVVRNYIDWLLAVPWKKQSRISKDLVKAQKILDDDHYGLEKVKDRILEYLAVQQRVKKSKAAILCLVGPPGVGKTSLGQSIARATNRKFLRMSLGGVRDEAEIRGHRRTYIGSMPGKVIQNLAKAKTRNPLFMLDEVDKMSMDFRGDPSSALLEVLDPEQNHTFGDHYLEVDYDLSDVMFIATANTLNIPGPLLDRMEVIRISGYTEEEKCEIADRYLLPKQRINNGLKESEVSVSGKAIREIIASWTREAGVRNLEREIAKIFRKVVKEFLLNKRKKTINITPARLEKYLGVKKYRRNGVEQQNKVGQVTGLAWTEAGGELLRIETVVMPGKGKHVYTGKLGDVMQESITAAISVVRSRSVQWGIAADFHQNQDIHIHVPEGATPKDGPSAGIGMCTAIVSALTGIPVWSNVAMTGEITLRGEVLPIGGLKEKLLAAHRVGLKTALIPHENSPELQEIPEKIRRELKIKPVKWIDEVIELALETAPRAKTASAAGKAEAKTRRRKKDEAGSNVTAH